MTDFNTAALVPLCENFSLTLGKPALERLETFGNLLLEWNEKFNLTAITEPGEVLYKHFYDSLLFFSAVTVPDSADIIDVGTGAGFPGLVLKIARPDINITLLDSLKKRVTFLEEAANRLGLQVTAVHLRAEEGGRKASLREKFDIATARAVANLNLLSEYCVPFVKPGGVFVAMKGRDAQAELAAAKGALNILGCRKTGITKRILRPGEERNFIIAEKTSQTPPKYPRNSAKIAKATL